MAGSAVTATSTGSYCLLEAAVPGLPQAVIAVLLLNPAEDTLYCRFRRDLDSVFRDGDDLEYFTALEDEIRERAAADGAEATLARFEATLSNAVRITDPEAVLVEDWDKALSRLYRKYVPAEILKFRTHLPLFSARAAAGRFGDAMEVEEEGWIEAPPAVRITPDMFVAHVTGRSMEPRIPDGSLCVFRHNVAGSRTHRLVLVENYGESGDNRYTIKRYRRMPDNRVMLEPLNPDYTAWEIEPDDTRIRVIAEFITVLE